MDEGTDDQMSQDHDLEQIESCSTAQAMIEFSANRLVSSLFHLKALQSCQPCILCSCFGPLDQFAHRMPDLSGSDSQRNQGH